VRRVTAMGLALLVAALGWAIGTRPGRGGDGSAVAVASTSARGVTFTPIDGGSDYFSDISSRSAWMDAHVLIGAWEEQPHSATEVGYDMAMGENIYWNLAGQPGGDLVDFNVIRAAGMHAQAPEEDANTGSETVGWQGTDEPDLNFGPGSGSWNTSSGCTTSTACGYTTSDFYFADKTANVSGDTTLPYTLDGREVSQGFGKGVLFFETNAQAAAFLRYSDILSADTYWLTDNNQIGFTNGACLVAPGSAACGNGSGPGFTAAQSKLPANYEYNVTRLAQLQALNGGSKPIVVDVETGCPFTGGSAGNCATPPQSIAAAWHALIAGARGIIWFQHNFSGPCEDDRTFIDGSTPSGDAMYNCQQTPGVTLHDLVVAIGGFDNEVKSLNSVLLSPTINGYVSNTGVVDTLAKTSNGYCYVFAGSGRPGTPPPNNQNVRFTLASGYSGPVSVYDENRTVQATGGVFNDTFADENAVHVYVIPDAAVCGSGGTTTTTTSPTTTVTKTSTSGSPSGAAPAPTSPSSPSSPSPTSSSPSSSKAGGSGSGASSKSGSSGSTTAGAASLTAGPLITRLTVSPDAFVISPRTLVGRYRHVRVSTVRWVASAAGNTVFSFERLVSGVRVKGRCVAAASHHGPNGGPCTHESLFPATLVRESRRGANHLRFTGWIHRRRLPAGRYAMFAIPGKVVTNGAVAAFRVRGHA
jgi:hypothetical protein